jgi:large subunit ribosomal protein L25
MKTITIEGNLRTGFGKTATRALRSQELVPGVIYGGSQEINFHAPAAAFKNLVYTPSFQVAEVVVDGKTYRTILKDLQFDKVDDSLIHVDLLELVEDKQMIADIPLKFVGVSPGVKDGGKLHIKMKSLKVKTYPKYLKEQIEVSIDKLELNGNIRVEDVKVDNYEILNSPRIPIASVTLTRQLKQEEAATPAAGAAPAAGAPAAAAAPAAGAAAGADKKEKK